MTSNRERFEEWYLAEFWDGSEAGREYLTKELCGGYIYAKPYELWKVWQAAQPALGEPVYQWYDETAWQECNSKREYLHAKDNGLRVRILWTAPPAVTQPATGEPVAWMTRPRKGSYEGREFLCQPDDSLNLDQWEKPFPLYAAPPAAAHGDEAVRKMVLPERIDRRQYLGGRGDAVAQGWNDCLNWIDKANAMRAQAGEGGE